MACSRIGLGQAARIVIQEDCANDCAQITTNALSIIVKHGGDAIDVAGAGIACDQPLNQLPTEKRPDVWMIENSIEGGLEFLLGSLSAENLNTTENRLWAGLMERGIVHHRDPIIFLRIVKVGYSTKVPTGENRGQTGHRRLVVGWNR